MADDFTPKDANSIREMFDARLTEIIVGNSVVQIPEPGLSFIFGRNGSGKTRLLQSLKSFSDKVRGKVSIRLIGDLPSKYLSDQWWSLVNVHSDRDLISLFNYANLPFMNAVLGGISRPIVAYPHPFHILKDTEILEYFGFSNSTIASVELANLWRPEDVPGGSSDQLKFTQPFSHYEFVGYSFLTALSRALINHGRFDDLNFQFTDSWRWIDGPNLSKLVGPAYEQFFASTSRIILSVGNNDYRYQFLAEVPSDGPLKEFLDISQKEIGDIKLGEDFRLTKQYGTTFPIDLMSPETYGDKRYIASSGFTLACEKPWREDYFGRNSEGPKWTPVGLSALDSGHDVEVKISEISSNYFSRFVKVQRLITDETATFTYVGLNDLSKSIEKLGKWLNDFDISIGGLRYQFEKSQYPVRFLPDPNLLRNDPFKNRTNPHLEWLDSAANEWRAVFDASQGQQDLIQMVLTLGLIDRASSSQHFIIADEFDRHLHPSATSKVIDKIQEIAVNKMAVALISTHSIPDLLSGSARLASRLYATRTIVGDFEYNTSSSITLEAFADQLGISTLDVLKLYNIHIFLEGNHDEIIFRHFIGDEHHFEKPVNIINSKGLYSYEGIWNNAIAFLNAPALFVYDKKNRKFEDEWESLKKNLHEITDLYNHWPRSVFWQMEKTMKYRKAIDEVETGDGELKKLLFFIKSIMSSRDARKNIPRVHFHGIDCQDIVDLLPRELFPKRLEDIKTWDDAHREFPNGDKLKYNLGIYDESVKLACQSMQDQVPKEIAALESKIRELLRKS